MQQFSIKTEQFEGPLDLLLQLVQKRKLHISEVSLAQVADDFVEFVSALESDNNARAQTVSEFVVVASTLLLIKSRALLPSLDLSMEEEESIEDLEERLRRLAIIQRVREQVKDRFGKKILVPTVAPRWREVIFTPPADLSLELVAESIWGVVGDLPESKKNLPKVAVKKIRSLAEVIAGLERRVRAGLKTTFSEFNKEASGVETVVNFLAILELFKRNTIHLTQTTDEDIQIVSVDKK